MTDDIHQRLVVFCPGKLRLRAFDVDCGKSVNVVFADKGVRIARLSGA
jgi:hypothetical protein